MEIIKEYGLNPIHELEYNGYETTGTKNGYNIFIFTDPKNGFKFYVRSNFLSELLKSGEINFNNGKVLSKDGLYAIKHLTPTLITNHSPHYETLKEKSGSVKMTPMSRLKYGDTVILDHKDPTEVKGYSFVDRIKVYPNDFNYAIFDEFGKLLQTGECNDVYDGRVKRTNPQLKYTISKPVLKGLFVKNNFTWKSVSTSRKVRDVIGSDTNNISLWEGIHNSNDYLDMYIKFNDIIDKLKNNKSIYDNIMTIFSPCSHYWVIRQVLNRLDYTGVIKTVPNGRRFDSVTLANNEKLLICQKFERKTKN